MGRQGARRSVRCPCPASGLRSAMYQFQFDVIAHYFGVLTSGIGYTLLITVVSFVSATVIGLLVSQLGCPASPHSSG